MQKKKNAVLMPWLMPICTPSRVARLTWVSYLPWRVSLRAERPGNYRAISFCCMPNARTVRNRVNTSSATALAMA